tara:strand:+ start:499 stop:768 length:270 start_codon:yes stop_codon:yes gene_type:complete
MNEERHFLDFLVIERSPEQDFKLEWDTRQILSCENREELAEMCVSLYQQNWAKDQIIANCLVRIGELEGQSVKMDLELNRPWWKKFLKR